MLTDSQTLQLQQGAMTWELEIDTSTLARFTRFAELLEEANRKFNLTRIAAEDIVTLHFLDSLALAAVLQPKSGDRLIDVGTGGGFPGLPLALAFPEVDVTLLDGTRKRLAFIDEVIAELGLANAHTLHGRAEEVGRSAAHRGRYDLVTARAVAKLPELAGWLLPLVRPGGHAVAYKSRDVEQEAAESKATVERLSGTIDRIAAVALPGTDIVRKLIVLSRSASVASARSAPPRRRK